jgi:two-component system sensor histidine kinase PilS (NtrC family)
VKIFESTSRIVGWQELQTLQAVRSLVGLTVLAATLGLDGVHGDVRVVIAATYTLLASINIALARNKQTFLSARKQLALSLATDLATFSALVELSGGIKSGMTLLFFVPAVAAALLEELGIALLIAAIASLVLLADAVVRGLFAWGDATLFQAGATGAAMFAVTLVLNRLAARLIIQETLVREKSLQLQSQIRTNLAVINEMRQGVLVVSPEGQVSAGNPAARRILDAPSFEQERDFGYWISRRYPTLSKLLAAWSYSAPATNSGWTVRLEAQSDGSLTQAGEVSGVQTRHIRVRPISTGPSQATDMPMLAMIEDLKDIQAEATQLKLASMGRLTASIAHEIRNPLAAISHATSLLAEEGNARQTRLLQIIEDNSRRLDRIVADVLSVSRSARVQSETVEMEKLVTNVIHEQTRDQGIDAERITIDIASACQVRFDRTHLNQIILNLIGNAVRYASASAGAIEVTLEDGPHNTLDLVVADDGPGISAEAQAQLFEPFFTTERAGTGLGLYLARELAMANGAELFLQLGTKRGAVFKLRLQAGSFRKEVEAS